MNRFMEIIARHGRPRAAGGGSSQPGSPTGFTPWTSTVPGAYADLLVAPTGAGELSLLVETLRVGETRFFRHRSHIRALQHFVVPELGWLQRSARASVEKCWLRDR